MNENEFRDLVHGTMSEASPPPPMELARTLRLGHRALVRRRAAWSFAGAGALAVVMLGGASLGHPGSAVLPGSSASPAPPPSPRPSTQPGTPWPTGPGGTPQQDRTARAGARYQAGVALMNTLIAALPAGYTVPANPPSSDTIPPRYNQAQFAYRVSGTEVWEYEANVEVTRDGRAGRVLAQVTTPGNTLPRQPCALAQTFWDMRGDCQQVRVGAAQVGVVVRPATDHRFDEWAAYRFPDGVVVYLAQTVHTDGGRPALATLPYTITQLATLATDTRFDTH
jgi:hypothetical protein